MGISFGEALKTHLIKLVIAALLIFNRDIIFHAESCFGAWTW